MQSAVCGGGHEMTVGVHCAHFEMRRLGGNSNAFVGVVGPGFDPAAGGRPKDSAEGWLMSTGDGDLRHGCRQTRWAGQPKGGEIKEGDVVVRRPPCAAPRRGCAEGLACACRAWCSTSTPAGATTCPRQLRIPFHSVLSWLWFRSLGGAIPWLWVQLVGTAPARR